MKEEVMYHEINYSCVSHIGNIRNVNQDNFICNGTLMRINSFEEAFPIEGKATSKNPILFGVFDGMGGEECGEIASYIAAKEASMISISNNSIYTLLKYCKHTNKKICEYANNNSISAMGTTAAILLFSKNKITLCNIGDSKVFRFSDDSLEQISKDHVVISAFGTKPPLSQNLGIPPEQLLIEPHLSQGTYKDGDRYLICSDGLTDMLPPEDIKELLHIDSLKVTTTNLLNSALKNGGRDNITIILLEIKTRDNKFIKVIDKQSGGRKL